MTFKETHERITTSKVFQNFKSDYPNSTLCAGFFIIDIEQNNIKKTLDYIVDERVFTFTLDNNEITMQEDKLVDSKGRPKLSKINPTTNIDPEDLKGTIGIEALDNGIKEKLTKIIAVLQNYSGKETNNQQTQIWNLTCIFEGFIILHILIDSETKKILKFEKKNMMDWIKKT